MSRHKTVRRRCRTAALLFAIGALLASGCGAPSDGSSFDRSVRLLDAGTPPTTPLRYRPRTGPPIDLRLTIDGGGERLTYDITRQVTDVGGGTFTLRTGVSDVRADATPGSGADGTNDAEIALRRRLADQAEQLAASSLTERVATDGMILRREVEGPNPGARSFMTLLSQQLELLSPAFPLEPVGDRAGWVQEFGLPDLLAVDGQVSAVMSIVRTPQPRAATPVETIDLTLTIAGPVREGGVSSSAATFPAPRVVVVTGQGSAMVDSVAGITTGEVTYRMDVERIRLDSALTREPVGIRGPISIAVVRR